MRAAQTRPRKIIHPPPGANANDAAMFFGSRLPAASEQGAEINRCTPSCVAAVGEGFSGPVCAPAYADGRAGEFGKAARVKVTWLVAANDSYFSPAFSRQLVGAFRGAGGKADFRCLPAHGSEGHWLVETEGG